MYSITLSMEFLCFCKISSCERIRKFANLKIGLLCNIFSESEVIKIEKNRKQTSKSVATKASKILKDGRYSKESKSVAGSALAQAKPGKRK